MGVCFKICVKIENIFLIFMILNDVYFFFFGNYYICICRLCLWVLLILCGYYCDMIL